MCLDDEIRCSTPRAAAIWCGAGGRDSCGLRVPVLVLRARGSDAAPLAVARRRLSSL
jgi:hypothetical protein